jgi:hypothetical protein
MNKIIPSEPTQNNYRVIELKFDKAEVPKFREVRGKNFISFGVNNDYPKYLISLFNESAKHGSIIRGKCNYIYGKGFAADGKVNALGETWNEILKKCIKDDELFRGYFLQIVWNRAKLISDIYHIEFSKVRVNKLLDTFFVKNDWKDNREEMRKYNAYNPNDPVGSQILYVKEYNPFSEYYPLPVYYQGLNYIESDIEISRHILGNARRGFVASTLINLNNGDPITEEMRGEIERRMLQKFSGHDSARTVIMFNKSKDNAAEIINLGNSMLTKEDFTNINALVQQEIFAAHQITSPILFGIKTEGQLGGRNEIRDAYEIFSNTYVNERQQELEKVFTDLTQYVGESVDMKIIPVEPLKFTFSENILTQVLSKDEIREILGREPMETPADQLPEKTPEQLATEAPNDALKNLTGRQYQNVMRIVRQYTQGKINLMQAKLLLSRGYGLCENDVNEFLGVANDPEEDIQKFFDEEDDRMIAEFSACGQNMRDRNCVHSARIGHEFAEFKLEEIHYRVIELIRQGQKFDPSGWASKIGTTVQNINRAYTELLTGGYVKLNVSGKTAALEVVKELPKAPASFPKTKEAKVEKPDVSYSVLFTYEWRDVPGNDKDETKSRPFCRKMMNLTESGMTWSMSDIQKISLRLGYSVFDRCGGWWTTPGGKKSPQCRHEWVSRVYENEQTKQPLK